MPKTTEKYPNIKVFEQHGFVFEGTSGNQVYGYSIFSGKDTFYINPKTKMWDCKSSGKNGGYQSFLQEVHKLSLENMGVKEYSFLRDNRGLQKSTLKKHLVGFNPNTNDFLIPVFDANLDKLQDLKKYNPKKSKKFSMMSSAGAIASLYGWEDIISAQKVWLVEGEWDKMAMWEILNKTKRIGTEIVVAAPGARTFKADWGALFKDKDVTVVYDNDYEKEINGKTIPGAGGEGSIKVYKALKNITSKLDFVHWNKKLADGYDVRDHLANSDSYQDAYESLIRNINEAVPVKVEFKKDIQDEVKADEDIFTGPFIPARKVYGGYRKWLHLPDTTVLDVIFGTLIANRLDGDPLWMFIVAPSGATKTELLMSISEAQKVMSTTTLTPHSLVSGANAAGGGDPSLIPRLDGKVLIIKDFTTILNMNDSMRDEIFGIFRDAFDGKTEKVFGHGITRSYKSKFGILSGVTPAIDLYTEGQTALGERFLRFVVPIGETYKEQAEYIERAQGNVNKKGDMRKDLLDIGNAVLSHNYTKKPRILKPMEKKLIALAQWTAAMRASVVRDKYTKEVLTAPFAELGTRLVKQCTKLLIGISMFRGLVRATDKEYRIVKDVAISSVPRDLNILTKYMYKKKKCAWVPIKNIQTECGLPSESCRKKLENLLLMKVIDKRIVNKTPEYAIKEDIKFLFKNAGIYT